MIRRSTDSPRLLLRTVVQSFREVGLRTFGPPYLNIIGALDFQVDPGWKPEVASGSSSAGAVSVPALSGVDGCSGSVR